jgi:DNA-directed RNA polymerase subunit M/transcription elongation factor TFIIS
MSDTITQANNQVNPSLVMDPTLDRVNQMDMHMRSLPFTLDSKVYQTADKPRRIVMLMIGKVLDRHSAFKRLTREEQSQWVEEIENSCMHKALEKAKEDRLYVDWENPRFTYNYQLIVSRVSKNLDIDSEVNSEWLFNEILSGEIDREIIASLSSEQLTNKSSDIQAMIDLRRKQKLNYKTSTLYTCKNCKGRKCTVHTQQTRSLDEGFTIVCNCTICGHRFMMSG